MQARSANTKEHIKEGSIRGGGKVGCELPKSSPNKKKSKDPKPLQNLYS